MKHDLRIIVFLVIIFLISQIVGLILVNQDIQITTTPTGQQIVFHPETVIGPRPDIQGLDTFIFFGFSIFVGTMLLLLLIKFGKMNWWKVLFFFAVFMTVSVSLGVVIPALAAFIIAFVLALLKIIKHNVVIHNFTEILMYSGLVLLFTPLFDLFWIAVLLILISVYDMFAVWKSKHMITIAESIMKEKVFAGFSISYESKKAIKKIKGKLVSKKSKTVKEKVQVTEAVLGGGDIAFPLLFAAVVMEFLINTLQIGKELAFLKVMIIPVFVTIALLFLLLWSKRGRFYPAMPFVAIGCFAGLGVVLLI